MGKELFISHSTEDIEKVNQICKLLENYGIDFWIAPRELLLVLSSNSNTNRFRHCVLFVGFL